MSEYGVLKQARPSIAPGSRGYHAFCALATSASGSSLSTDASLRKAVSSSERVGRGRFVNPSPRFALPMMSV